MRPWAAVLLAALPLCGCGGSRMGGSAQAGNREAVYPAKWEPTFHLAAPGHSVFAISRTALTLQLRVIDQTCHTGDPRYADAAKRVAGVVMQEQRAAVVVTVHMHPEPTVRGCVPTGIGFPITVKLAHPLGPRALVDGGSPRVGGGAPIAVIKVPATSRKLEREAEALYGPADVPAVP